MTKKLQYLALFVVTACVLSACKDKEEKNEPVTPQSSVQTQTSTQEGKTPGIDACDAYIAQMKSCIDSKASAQDKEQLNASLDYLKKQMAESADQEQIAQVCQKNLDGIQEQKKALGCV